MKNAVLFLLLGLSSAAAASRARVDLADSSGASHRPARTRLLCPHCPFLFGDAGSRGVTHSLTEEALNAHINVEYSAHYQYQAMWAYFDRDDVALPGLAKFFKSMVTPSHLC